jgi:hypothetical protein
MYFPKEDHIKSRKNGSIRAKTRGHIIDIDAKGGIVISGRIIKRVEFSKAGVGK